MTRSSPPSTTARRTSFVRSRARSCSAEVWATAPSALENDRVLQPRWRARALEIVTNLPGVVLEPAQTLLLEESRPVFRRLQVDVVVAQLPRARCREHQVLAGRVGDRLDQHVFVALRQVLGDLDARDQIERAVQVYRPLQIRLKY